MVQDLMPVSTEAPRCSEFARSIDVLPPGTGLFLSRVVLVSVPLPWPKPALKHEQLVDAATLLMAAPVPTRLFAAESTGASGLPIVEVFERDGGQAQLYRWTLTDSHEITPLIEAIAHAETGSLDEVLAAGVFAEVISPVPPTVLVCTQGSHDTCCGTSGVALADEIERERPGVVVRRVSHTGGHRFSPTLLAFPEGRMWAFADLALVDRITSGTATANDHYRHGRGWWGARVGPAQVAETAVRAERAQEPFCAPTIQPLDGQDGRSASIFVISVGEESWQVDVHVGREIPTIACESPGGLPVKPGREFAWTIERR